MRKVLFAAGAAVAAIAGLSFAQDANAQACGWNGYAYVCSPSTGYGVTYPYGYYPYPSEGGSFPNVTGYKPPWQPSYPGPRASSGAGH
ncbi:MAG TPA: hypothetical protein VFA12_05310 [Stellaceae bacterium]|nr:hypothetical protein [Stellaceae bacterium]